MCRGGLDSGPGPVSSLQKFSSGGLTPTLSNAAQAQQDCQKLEKGVTLGDWSLRSPLARSSEGITTSCQHGRKSLMQYSTNIHDKLF